MTNNKPNPIVRVLPSLTDVAFLMPVIFLFWRMGGSSRMLEGDTGWHIRTGEWILQNRRVPDTDIFSFTKAGEPWFAWEWLWDVIFAWLHQQWGMAGVILVSLFVICLTFALLFRLSARKCGNVFIAFGATWLATAASTLHWWARPHVFTLLFAVIFYSLLERVRDGRTSLLWILPFLTVVWTNLHGGFFVGILLLAAYAGGEMLAALLEPEDANRKAAFKRSVPYVLTGVGCFLASFVNPYFYKLHLHIFQYLTDDYHFRVVSEFQSISFQIPPAGYFEALIVLGLVAAVWHAYRRRFVYPLLLLGWLHLALTSARNIPLFAIAAAPAVAMALYEMLAAIEGAAVANWCKRMVRSFQRAAADFGETDGIGRIHLASAAVALLLAAAVSTPGTTELFTPDYDPKLYPSKAVETLAATPAARIFTTDEWGDYLIYRLYPATKVFIDGRSDFYGADLGNRYLDTMRVKYDWDANLNRHDIDTVLLPVASPLAGAMKESRLWRIVYDDGVALVFLSAATPAEAEGQTSSIVSDSGSSRDLEITNADDRDRKITKTQLYRRQPL